MQRYRMEKILMKKHLSGLRTVGTGDSGGYRYCRSR